MMIRPRRGVIAAAAAALLPLLAACASAPPLQAPQWDMVPAAVVEALCQRLHADALATGSLKLVRVTQPLATPESVAALEGAVDDGRTLRAAPPSVISRAIPVSIGRGSCAWQAIEILDARDSDTTVVELSSPLLHPYASGQAGLFARASLGGTHPAWYWIALVRSGDEWKLGRVSVLFR